MEEGKSFEISWHQVLEAYKRVKANHGASGVDGVNFEEFEKELKNNLYKIWNRKSSGSSFWWMCKGWKNDFHFNFTMSLHLVNKNTKNVE